MSHDGETFEVDVEIAKQSQTIKTKLDDLGVEEVDGKSISLPDVDADILKKVYKLDRQLFFIQRS